MLKILKTSKNFKQNVVLICANGRKRSYVVQYTNDDLDILSKLKYAAIVFAVLFTISLIVVLKVIIHWLFDQLFTW